MRGLHRVDASLTVHCQARLVAGAFQKALGQHLIDGVVLDDQDARDPAVDLNHRGKCGRGDIHRHGAFRPQHGL